MADNDDWPDMGKELREVLANGLDVGGTIDEDRGAHSRRVGIAGDRHRSL